MARERGATQVVQALVKSGRARVVFIVQTVCLALVAAFVWGWIGSAGYPLLAYGIIGGLALMELILLVLFLREKPESDEHGIQVVSDDAEQLVLTLPGGQDLVLNRKLNQILAQGGAVCVPTVDVRFIQVDEGDDVRMLAATNRDLVVLCHLVNPTIAERADVTRVARRLARSAQVPFEEQ